MRFKLLVIFNIDVFIIFWLKFDENDYKSCINNKYLMHIKTNADDVC